MPAADLTVLVAVPVLARPARVAPLLASLRDAERQIRYRTVFLASPGDTAEHEALTAAEADYTVVPWKAGAADWARKINHAYRDSGEPWIFAAADDLCFHPGWADEALAVADATGKRVVGTNDLLTPRVMNGKHATHSLVARSYADELGTIDGPGAVFAEVYDHNFVDDEFIATARSRDEWAFAPGAHVEHCHHPIRDRSNWDDTYAKGQAQFAADRARWHSRHALIPR